MVISRRSQGDERQQARRDLLRRYLELQRELMDGDPGTSAYQGTIHQFRQMGYLMITSGFEEDLDRLLRIRLLDGGRCLPLPRDRRTQCPELHIMERVGI